MHDQENIPCTVENFYCQLNQLRTCFAFLVHSTSTFLCNPVSMDSLDWFNISFVRVQRYWEKSFLISYLWRNHYFCGMDFIEEQRLQAATIIRCVLSSITQSSKNLIVPYAVGGQLNLMPISQNIGPITTGDCKEKTKSIPSGQILNMAFHKLQIPIQSIQTTMVSCFHHLQSPDIHILPIIFRWCLLFVIFYFTGTRPKSHRRCHCLRVIWHHLFILMLSCWNKHYHLQALLSWKSSRTIEEVSWATLSLRLIKRSAAKMRYTHHTTDYGKIHRLVMDSYRLTTSHCAQRT